MSIPNFIDFKSGLETIAGEVLTDRLYFTDLGGVNVYYAFMKKGINPIQALEFLINSFGNPVEMDKTRSATNFLRNILALFGLKSQNEYLLHYQASNVNGETSNILIYLAHDKSKADGSMRRIRCLENTVFYGYSGYHNL